MNWKEVEILATWIEKEIQGRAIDRVFIPTRTTYPEGFLKGEIVLRFRGSKVGELLLHMRSPRPFVSYSPGKAFKPSAQATRSGLDLLLSKELKGQRVASFAALKRERCILVQFESLRLALLLIPNAPDAKLVDTNDRVVLALRAEPETPFEMPDGRQSPQNPDVGEIFERDLTAFHREMNQSIYDRGIEIRLQSIQRSLKDKLKKSKKALSQAETTLDKSKNAPDYQKWGDLLKASIHLEPKLESQGKRHYRKVSNYNNNEEVEIPCDPKLKLIEQVEKFYSQAKRSHRKQRESELRRNEAKEALERLLNIEARLDSSIELNQIHEIESALGIRSSAGKTAPKSSFAGRTFESLEELPILVGRNSKENVELTFKIARGNDIWLHVRGRPGAHVVIQTGAKKAPSLETLLDAAHLAILYSDGKDWGKTEVDYTQRKHVQKLKGGKPGEVTYHSNKTLMIDYDPARIKRLTRQPS